MTDTEALLAVTNAAAVWADASEAVWKSNADKHVAWQTLSEKLAARDIAETALRAAVVSWRTPPALGDRAGREL